MANQEHLEVLKQGKAAWDEWRAQHPDIQPDLSRKIACERLWLLLLKRARFEKFFLVRVVHCFYMQEGNTPGDEVSKSYMSDSHSCESRVTNGKEVWNA